MGQIHSQLVRAVLALGLMVPGLAAAYDGDWDHGGDRDHGGGYEHGEEHHESWEHGDAGCHGMATLSVQNTFDGDAQVFVDGRFVGMVGGDRTASFQVNSGSREVLVSRPGTNYVLSKTRLQMYNGTTFVLPVQAPTGMLHLDNTGEVTLKVRVGSASSVWIAPGSSVQIPVQTGNESLVASIQDPRGEWRAIERTIWVEPGQLACEKLHPDPTVVIITNHDRISVRALVDGSDQGFVAPGATKRVWVRPGSTNVLLLDGAGRVRSNTTVLVAKGREGRVVIEPRYGAPVGAVVTVDLGGRPGGPVRPTDPHSYR